MMRASIREEEDTTIARFLSGLSLEIRDRVELLPYQDLNDLVQLSIKVEQQILRKTSSQRVSSYSSFYPKKEFRREGNTSKEKQKEPTKSLSKETSTPPILMALSWNSSWICEQWCGSYGLRCARSS